MSDSEKPPSPLPTNYNPSGCLPKSILDAAKASGKSAQATTEPPPPPATLPQVIYDDWAKIDIRVGVVIEASRVDKSDKLLKLLVGFGELGTRQILAGIGLTFEPDAVVNERYLFVVNLAPRKMMGLESHGMMLAIGEAADKLSLVKTDAPVGVRVG